MNIFLLIIINKTNIFKFKMNTNIVIYNKINVLRNGIFSVYYQVCIYFSSAFKDKNVIIFIQ